MLTATLEKYGLYGSQYVHAERYTLLWNNLAIPLTYLGGLTRRLVRMSDQRPYLTFNARSFHILDRVAKANGEIVSLTSKETNVLKEIREQSHFIISLPFEIIALKEVTKQGQEIIGAKILPRQLAEQGQILTESEITTLKAIPEVQRILITSLTSRILEYKQIDFR